MAAPPSRVVFLNLAQIRLPVGALTSILHRVSGVLLALAIPLVAWAFARSLANPGVKVAAVLWIWALSHHLLAGVRHMLSDVDVGSRLWYARKSAYTVNIAAVLIAIAAAGAFW